MADPMTTKRDLQVKTMGATWEIYRKAGEALEALSGWQDSEAVTSLFHVQIRALELMGQTLAQLEPDPAPVE